MRHLPATHFTDTFYEINGVALTRRQQVQVAAAAGRRYKVITGDDRDQPPEKGVIHFTPIGTYDLPEYEQQKVFYFPSTTDTFGNVVLEAQASGLAVIVTDQGGPMENIIPEKTGIVVKADCIQSLYAAMAALISDPRRRSEMGRAARRHSNDRSFEAAFDETWQMFGNVDAQKKAMAG
jgi:glycosyltransferase involved in cell wall biosynthesis